MKLHWDHVPAEKAAMRAALDRARLQACREVRFAPGGVVAVDPLGNEVALTRGGVPAPIPMDDVLRALSSHSLRSHSGSRDSDMERDFGPSGTWTLAKAPEGCFTLKAKKPGAFCLEQVLSPLTDADADGLARLRSAYRLPDVDVAVLVEGEHRARDVASAIAAERAILGLPVGITHLREYDRPWGHRDPEPEAPPFDPPAGPAPWHVERVESGHAQEVLTDAPTRTGGGRVRVGAERTFWRVARAEAEVAGLERPCALVVVQLEKSRPVARVFLSDTLRATTSPDPGFANAPWDVHAGRADARRRSRPPAPRTWHPTTEAVAHAFVARQAPRGMVSGDALFFHGPVAYSTYRSNPIAAIVDAPDGKPVILMGRSGGIGGGKAAIVSSAQGDVSLAARDAFRVVDVENLAGIATLGGKPVENLADGFRYRKDEAEHPRSCEIDHEGLTRWMLDAWDAAVAEATRAGRNNAATYVKAQAISALAGLSEKRDLFAGTFGVALPPLGDASALRSESEIAFEAAAARQRALDGRGKAPALPAPAEPGEGLPGPRM